MAKLITASYNDAIKVDFTQEAWFNATAVAAPFDKRPNDWLNLESTKEYLAALAEIPNYQESWYLKTTRGKFGGTWLHPKLAIPFARWLDVRFAVWCDMQIETILKALTSPNNRTDGTLIPSEQQTLSEIVMRKAETVPKELIGKALAEIWSRVHRKFRVSKYEQLPRTQLTDAALYVMQMQLRTGGKALPKEDPPKALPLDIHYPLESAAPPVGCSGLGYYAFAQAEGWVDPCYELLMQLRAAGLNVDGPIYSHQAARHVMAAMYNALIDKAVDNIKSACVSLPYAPVYLPPVG
jgi:hypothetical protein